MYANAGQLQAQIKNSGEGDLFIAGAVEELKPVEQFVTAKQLLVKHIPVLAVRQGNPKNRKSISRKPKVKKQARQAHVQTRREHTVH